MAKKTKSIPEATDTAVTFEKEMSDIYDDNMSLYATEILTQRALPNLEDGLKNVHLLIAWAMYNMNLKHTGPTTKSIKIVGRTFNWYLHGDSSCYLSLTKMSQDWYLNQPLIIPQGSFGSNKTPNSESSARYTEAKMSLYLETMMEYIDKAGEFIPNFDGTTTQPKKIPTLLPNILVNRSSGIAIGYATEFLPHNLVETCQAEITRIKSPNCRLDTILKVMPAPDFNTGGTILNYNEVKRAYETGMGKATVRGDIEIDEKHHMLIVKSIPYETYLDNLLHQLDLIVEKDIGINDFTDKSECATAGGLYNINVEIYCDKKADLEFLKNYLFKNTLLQINLPINMMAVVNSKKPVLCNLLFILDKLIEYHNSVLVKAYTFDLKKAQTRKEIVEGLLKATENKSILDDIIKIIRGSSTKQEAKEKLMKKYKFTELQTDSILALRLSQLVNTDIIALKEELEQLKTTIKECDLVINDKSHRQEVLIKKLKEYQKMFPQERKTQIDFDITHTGDIQINSQELISDEDRVVALSKAGMLKLCSTKSFNSSEHWTSDLDLQDFIIKQELVNNKHFVFCFTSKGRCLPVQIHKLKDKPWKSQGVNLGSKFDILLPQETMVYFTSDLENSKKLVWFATKKGGLKLMELKVIPTTRQKFTQVCKLKDDDEVIACGCCGPKDEMYFITARAKVLKISLADINLLGKVSGTIKGISLKKDDYVIAAFDLPVKAESWILLGNKDQAKKIAAKEVALGNRATQGINITPDKTLLTFATKLLPEHEQKNQYIQCIDNNDKIHWLVEKDFKLAKISQKMADIIVPSGIKYCHSINGIKKA